MFKLSDYQKGSIFGFVISAFSFTAAYTAIPSFYAQQLAGVTIKGGQQYFWEWVAHDAAGFFTLGLCLIGAAQALLFVWQLSYMRQSIRDAKSSADAAFKAAEAASLQATAAVESEAPYILVGSQVQVLPIEGTEQFPFVLPEYPYVVFKMTNIGRTAAIRKRECVEVTIRDRLPSEPTYRPHQIAPGSVMPTLEEFEHKHLFSWTVDERADISAGRKHLYVYGFIEAEDFIGRIHTVCYCFMGLFHARERGSCFDFVINIHTPDAYLHRSVSAPPRRDKASS